MSSAYNLSCILLSLSFIVSSLELLSLKTPYLLTLFQNKRLALTRHGSIHVLLIVQCILSLSVVCFSLLNKDTFLAISFWGLFLTGAYLFYKKSIGRDGADQLRLIAVGILAFTSLSGDPELYAVIFISLHTGVCYVTAAISKLLSPHWRKGDALGKILNNYTYGNQSAAAFLLAHKNLNKAATFFPIALMLLLPFAYIPDNVIYLEITLFFLLCFHLSTALFMGLNDFLLTFPSTYPCLIVFHAVLH